MEKEEVGQRKREKVSREEALAKLFKTPSPSSRGYWSLSAEEFTAIFPLLPPLELSPWLRRKALHVGGQTPMGPDLKVCAKTKLDFMAGDPNEEGLGFDDGTKDGLEFKENQLHEETKDGLWFEDSQLPEDSEAIEDSFACWYDHLNPKSPLEVCNSVEDVDGTCVPESLPRTP